ncbi:MAG: hypothetical protein AB4372_20470, partial [Xenococcus sp. (in: cyanobacteria)]
MDFSSSSISDQLKNDLSNAGALIVIATIDSLRSPWILFEVGSFWTTDKLVAPIIGPGLTFEDLPGPLKGYRSIHIEDDDVSYQLNELINQLASKLNLKQSGVTRRGDKKLEALISHFRAWKSQLPDLSQQENIEDLLQKVEEIETRSRQEKQELEQSLQYQIRELEQELGQERSRGHKQLKQLEEQSLQQQLEEKKKLKQDYQNQKQELEQSLQRIKQLENQRSQAAQQLEEKERLLQVKIEQLKIKNDEIISLKEKLNKQSLELNEILTRLGLTFELYKILKCLGLIDYYPGKLGREEVYSIIEYSLNQNRPKTTEELVKYFLSNLISFNYEGRKLKIVPENSSTNNSDFTERRNRFNKGNYQSRKTNEIHPLDVVSATFLCCNPIIRQDLVQRLWACKLAIPLVIQENKQQSPKFFLWAIRSLVMKWKITQEGKSISQELNIASYPVETVSFIRFDRSEISKSSLLNWVISEKETDKSHPIFFHRNLEGPNKNRQLSEGMIEIAWYLPQGSDKDNFQDIVSFLNLRGDARQHPHQLKLIQEISAQVVILASAEELQTTEAQIIRDLLKAGKAVIILITDKDLTSEKEENINQLVNSNGFVQYIDKQLTILDIKNKNIPDIRNEIRDSLKHSATQDKLKNSLENIAQKLAKDEIQVDELEETYQIGIRQAEKLMKVIQSYDLEKRKEKLLPLQGKPWADWSEADQEIYRLEKIV